MCQFYATRVIRLGPILAAAVLIGIAIGAAPAAHAVPEERDTGRETAPAPAAVNPLRAVAAARRMEPVTVDGNLGESAWQRAPEAGDFWQREPKEGQPPNQPTAFRVLYDQQALYVGVRAYDREPDRIRGLLTRRDENSPSDWITVGIDSYGDRRTSFTFSLNPAGVQRDMLIYDDVEEDQSWNAVWQGAAAVDGDGWTVELRIPYSQLRFARAAEQIWGLQVMREVQRTGEVTFWSPSPKSKSQLVSLFGHVTDIRDIRPRRRIELLPYTLAGVRVAEVDDGDPFGNSVGPELGLGLDFQYGLTSNFTLSGTINPDFGQVESDPAQVNLSASETFLAEKRPFFLEGADIFRFSLAQGDNAVEQLFYSRRLGAAPHGEASGDYAEQDAATSIIGAAKVSGKTRSGWSIGALTALTAEEEARSVDDAGNEMREVVEPLTNYSVLRLKKDFNDGRTSVGLAATNVVRALDGTGLDDLHRRAHTGGLQFNHRSSDGQWLADLRLAGSSVHGAAAAIDATQQASQRYYQRPDAEHLGYDPNRTSLLGWAAMGSLSRLGSAHWRGAVGVDARSPGFEVNDLGFQRRADYITNWVWGQYRDNEPGGQWRNYGVNLNGWTVSDWSPQLLSTGGNVNGWANLSNFWGFSAGVGMDGDRLNPRLLRGGPAVLGTDTYSGWVNLWSDSRKPVRGEAGGNGWYQPESDSWSVSSYADVVVQARSNLEFRLGSFLSRTVDDTQYIDEVTDTQGRTLQVLGRVDQTTLGLTARLNYTLSSTLSLQVYAQPFIGGVAYRNYKGVDQPRADSYDRRFRTYTAAEIAEIEVDGAPQVQVDRDGDGIGDFRFDRPDFNIRDFRATAVARWEYRPGSTLFLIWNHNRSADADNGRLQPGRDLADLGRVDGEHVILCKLSYFWAP